MPPVKTPITKESTVTISIVLSIGTLICGLSFWTGQLYYMVNSHSLEIQLLKENMHNTKVEIEKDRKVLHEKMNKWTDKLGKIDGRLDTILIFIKSRKRD